MDISGDRRKAYEDWKRRDREFNDRMEESIYKPICERGDEQMNVKVERIKMLEDVRGRFSPIMVCPGWQMNEVWSKTGVFRGMHVQDPGQRKIVRCVRGRILDLWIDPNGVVGGTETSSDNGELIDIPSGYLHGYISLEPSLVQYFVDRAWNPNGEKVYDIRSPQFDWTKVSVEFYDRVICLRTDAIVSERDKTAQEWKK